MTGYKTGITKLRKYRVKILFCFIFMVTAIPFFAKTYFVKTDGNDSNTGLSWDTSYQTLTKAMSAVSANDEVAVAAGIYQEGAVLTVPDNVTIYGGFAGTETVLAQRDIERNQVIIDGNKEYQCVDNSGTLDGLIIRKGKSSSLGVPGGIHNGGTLVNCIVYENSGAGGGIQNSGTIDNCIVYNNNGIFGGIDNNGTVTNSTIYKNTGLYGGGIDNHGTVSNCKVYQNRASFGGGIYNNGAVINCTIYNNFARASGGISNVGSVTNCTVYGNTSHTKGGGIHNRNSITNSIIWGNSPEDLFSDSEDDGSVTFSCYEKGKNITGQNNIHENPSLLYTSGKCSTWDLHLQTNSPCIDTATSADAPEKDLEGIIRPQGHGVDIGAYEFSEKCRAIFYADKNRGQTELSVQFRDASYGSPNSWAWDFDGDREIDSYEQNPLFVYKTPGFYTVSLTVSNGSKENTKTKVRYICIGEKYFVSPNGNDSANGLSWDSAYKTITKAISMTSSYDGIWIAAGIYQEGDVVTVPGTVTLYGGFSGTETDLSERDIDQNKVILDGNYSHHVLRNKGTVNGLHVRRGHSANGLGSGIVNESGTVLNCTVYENHSIYEVSGIDNRLGSVVNCKIYDNTAYSGGGIYNYGGIIENCDIHNNKAERYGGGIYNDSGSISNCNVYNNAATSNFTSHGGGIYNNHGIVDKCTVYGNNSILYGGGIFNEEGTVKNVKTYNNSAGGGGGIYNNGFVFNSLIFDNNASYDGGVRNRSGIIVNCTIYGNTAIDFSNGVRNEGTMKNCIAWGNGSEDIVCGTMAETYFNCYENGEISSGHNNIQQAPLFVNTTGDSSTWDFHLKSGSPCIDKGTSEDAPETDIEGTTRPQGAGFDMGADEYSSECKAVFFADKRFGQPDLEVQFQDASYGTPDSWAWDFQGDGIIDSYEQNPLFGYQTPGFYTVTLTVSNATEEDSETKVDYIYVSNRYYVSLSGNDANNGHSWASSFNTIQEAIIVASAGDEIYISAGTYREGTLLYVPSHVTLYGGFAGTETSLNGRNIEVNRVIIDGNNSHKCFSNSGTLDGLYVTKGKADSNDNDHDSGGIQNRGTVVNCTVYDNKSLSGGGINNEQGTVKNCTIYNNTAKFNGGIRNKRGTIINCAVYGNSNGGIGNYLGTVTNCTVYNNHSVENTYGLYNYNGNVMNSIIWGNSPHDILCEESASGTISYCCYGTGENVSGENNLVNTDPLFTNNSGDISTWDFHLQLDSPCIDSGTSDGAPATDLEGTARPQGTGFDMGAYEFTEECKAIFYADKRFGLTALSVQFHDASYGSPISWAWDFQGDGTVDSNEQNPLFVYQNPGFYTVSLTVSNGNKEDSETKIDYIYVSRRYYVSPDGNDENDGLSWSSAYKTLRNAINKTFAHDEVWISAGIYLEGVEVTVPSYVTVYGGFAGTEISLSERNIDTNQVILDGSESHRVLYNSGTLNGLYVTKGNSSSNGGGIYNYTGKITNCTVYNNTAIKDGGGIYNDGMVTNCTVYDNTSSENGGGIYSNAGNITNCTVYRNTSKEQYGGGIYNAYGTVTSSTIYNNTTGFAGGGIYNSGIITSCTVYGNTAMRYSGGGIYNDGTVTSCTVYENTTTEKGGGIYNYTEKITNCTVYNNTAIKDGGGIYNDGMVTNCTVYDNTSSENGGGIYNDKTAINCTVYNNRASYGGGIFIDYERTVTNCTAYGNTAENSGGGIYNGGGKITNCIVWNNSSQDIYCYYSPNSVNYCCYGTGEVASGENNLIDIDPLFVDTSGESSTWDFHLKSDSPCIDAGNSDDAPETDIEGTTRPQGAGFDMGAYEYFQVNTNVERDLWTIMK